MPVAATTVEILAQGQMAAAGGSAVPVINVFHFFRTVAQPTWTKAGLITAWQANTQVPWLLACSDRYTLQRLRCRFLDDATDPYVDTTVAASGAIAGDGLPSMNTVFMYYKPFLRTRIARGNKKFAGIPEAHTTGDVLTGAGLILWQTLQAALQAQITDALGNKWDPTVVSRKAPAQYAVNPTTIVQNVIQSVALNRRVGRLKRRETISEY